MTTYQRETRDTSFKDIIPVLPLHYNELAVNKDAVPLDPDLDLYRQFEELGVLHIFTARSGSELVGYIIGFIRPHIHYKSTLHYFNDIYYVKKEFRNNGVGVKFFQEHEKNLKTLGVKRIVTFTKLHQSHELLFKALGYSPVDKLFTKIID
jgi:GNAT superfamily N-acetyltransferase